ncbi:MAG: ATP-dependent DNA helicase [Nanoarchaeota archaeon]|nr:ATP-dependent DNA helicase [Nanoarchaeota archaeon]
MDVNKEINDKIRGPCVILAGAGTGKTYAIVEKIKYLIKNKIYSPEKIVCITFSNEAANNLLSRVRIFLDSESKEPVIRTFHGFSADILREHGHLLGIKPDFKILDPDEAKVLLHRNLRVQAYHCHKYIASINSAKDLGISIGSIQDYLDKKAKRFQDLDLEKRLAELQFQLQTLHLKSDKEAKKEILVQIKDISSFLDLKKFMNAWNAYEKIKSKNNYQDYSDLNQKALSLLDKFPEAAANYDYIVVDEFQDTNKIQIDFLISLALKGNVTIVGDLNQSIYRFRGAYKDNFNVFKKHFGITDKDIYNLDMSRRSSNKILRAAHSLILNNYSNPQECFEVKNHEGREGDNIEVYELKNGKEESRKVAELVVRELAEGRKPEEICIMFRTHQQGRAIKRMLEMKGLPFTSITKGSLLKNKIVRSVIDYLVILDKIKKDKKGGEQAWWDIIYQFDFPEEDLIKIGRLIKDNKDINLSSFLVESLPEMPLSDFGRKLSERLIDKIRMMQSLDSEDIVAMLKGIYTIIGFNDEVQSGESKEFFLNLSKFLELAQNHASLYYSDLSSFINYLETLESLGIEIPAAETGQKGVRLMTLHSTKGLEYETVIVTNMANKRFPMEKINSHHLLPIELSPEFKNLDMKESEFVNDIFEDYERKHQLSEERRLCYVAFTRAKNKLILTYANEYGDKEYVPSVFLEEVKYKQNPDFSYASDFEEKYKEESGEKPVKLGFSTMFGNGKELIPLNLNEMREREKIKPKASRCFSPSALLLFVGCQKEYEYKYVYSMPERKTISWEAMKLGSFVHFILEKGVQDNLRNIKDFLDLARSESVKEEWAGVELIEALQLIKVFFERNKDKYNERSLTEQELRYKAEGFEFIGFADRIDFSDHGLEIIDYKTGRQVIAPKHRDWQLGYYALASQKFGKVHKVTLDMLKQEKPLEFVIDDQGNAKSLGGGRMSFNIYDVQKELIETARSIINAYSDGFKACPIEDNCEFCNEYVYGL